MGNAANVLVLTGFAYAAPSGTALPTTVGGALNGAFVDLGLVSDDGLVEAHNQETKDIPDWSGVTVKTLIPKQTDTYKLTFLEHNPDTLEIYHGPQTDVSVVIEGKKQSGTRQCWVFDLTDGAAAVRIVIPDGQVTTTEDVQYQNDEVAALGVTITCYPDGSSNTYYKYVQDSGVS